MNILLSIFRWLIALFFGFVMFVLVVTLIPFSIAGNRLFERESGMKWLTAFTNDKTAVESLIDGLFSSMATSNSIEDPVLKEVAKYAADKNSPLGSVARKVLNPTSVGQNLISNAVLFYSWEEGKSETLSLSYKLGGTSVEQAQVISEFLKIQYANRETCTSSERSSIKTSNATDILNASCSVGPLSSSAFDNYAKSMLADPEAKKILANGFVYPVQVTSEDRKGVLVLQKLFGAGVIVAWLVLIVSALFMVLLFTPKGVNYIVTGIIVGITGLAVAGMGQALSSFGDVLRETLGGAIFLHGALIGITGLLLMVTGIVLIARGGGEKGVAEAKVVENKQL
ncbi:hypothetical protein COZ14_02800 [Candidatus Dojkabacteria bacterium CG_4_10_14_3_um_filter_Dojkabacteria_WS6_41_9]|uniref:Uncharacterized protein n=1 Tax=Candidatus Dojkabacteria bacterium CG_4_10_14_0_2_um_filter_Dojkabacteria_WS6_41_15 TaxID=2014249 RepID=A0A2M7W2J8_9BACT|nr:MAG: hypothetical protein COZ14_02800 [Candidatus Dojkabacteria bacterium CG_4_10_14_3_um_filter_Dojkabacteria_WS6_41_9]PJA15003.1 MAG: hypothetical protein COX64_01275 [Candidatus Dojkabacteria bacterium CG_4_10_14_0_2_um_filter_Dojkabacteria_WS6_41_15]